MGEKKVSLEDLLIERRLEKNADEAVYVEIMGALTDQDKPLGQRSTTVVGTGWPR